MTDHPGGLVSVIIPAYNGGATIDETLRSVRAQTHRALEILVVDDGSTDETVAIAQRHANQDRRIKIIRQRNAGVAAARNTGWQIAASDLIAFVDADDLWAATKIERQLTALAAAGEKAALAYCYYARIDGQSRIIEKLSPNAAEGEVLDHLMIHNFVGNGSAALVRREALIRASGFESALHAAGAQGCEDILFYCRVAEHFHFVCVPDFLVGYRDLPDNMSSNMPRMLRSSMLVIDEFSDKYPARRKILIKGLRYYAEWLIRRAVFARQPRRVPPILWLLLRTYPGVAALVIFQDLPKLGLDLARRLKRRLVNKWRGTTPVKEVFPAFSIGVIEPVDEAAAL